MKRRWFQDADGTYYRNCPLITAEMRRCTVPWRWRRFWRLDAEWHKTWREGLIRKDQLGRGDVLVQRRPFREAYPDDPILWQLDEVK